LLPELETPRLRLRPRTLSDFDACFAMDQDPRVAHFIWGEPPEPESYRKVLRGRFAPDWPTRGGIWTVEERAAPGFLGWCGLFPLEETGLIEIGYRYVPEVWGRGIATEAAACALDHGFRVFQFDPIVAVVHLDNRASQRVVEKIGLQRLADGFHYGVTVAVFSLSRTDYLDLSKDSSAGPA
jgi:RimJ/RimL family protein N-acetyltransferase